MSLPETGLSAAAIRAEIDRLAAADLGHDGERAFGYVFAASAELDRLSGEIMGRFAHTNGLDPRAYPSTLAMENQVVGMVGSLIAAPSGAAGNVTSGGTESIICAVLSARERARARGVSRPTLIIPETAHAAFHKAAHLLGLERIVIPVDRSTFRADPAATRAAVDERTALIAGSAPSYPHGVIDPIDELGAIAEEHRVPLHVDACVGGMVLPFYRELGVTLPAFDFSVPGVTSVSVDLHKYGYCPKGASVIVYRDAELRAHQLFACAGWPGYTVVNTTLQSSKSAAPLAAAWAVLRRLGKSGYRDLAATTSAVAAEIAAGLEASPGFRLLAPPLTPLLAFEVEGACSHDVADELGARGWLVHPQPGLPGQPSNIHLTVHPGNAGAAPAFLADLERARAAAREAPSPSLPIDPAGLAGVSPGDAVGLLAAALGADPGALPEKMAPINRLLSAADPAVAETLLIAYVNQLYRPAAEEIPS